MSTTGVVDSAEFLAACRRASEWIATYLDGDADRPVMARVRPGEIRAALPDSAPALGEPLDRLLDDFERTVLPGITHWNHPRFFNYFAISSSEPGILAEFLIAALNVNAMLWRTSPAATEIEEVAADWVRQEIGLPSGFSGVINDTASTSTLYALVAAREAVPGLDARRQGADGRRLRVYTSAEAHSSVEKACITIGVGQAGCVKVPTDDRFQIDPAALQERIDRDLAAGLTPIAVVATIGTTGVTAVDPVPEIAEICARHGLWLHVDAAYGGAAAVLPSHRWVLDGCERADSLVVNPHKWLFTPIDCSLLYCRREDVLKQAFSLVPVYLSSTEGDQVRNLMDFGNALGRRFRGLKLWFVLRALGMDRIRELIAGHLAMAQQLRSWVEADPRFEPQAPVHFSTVVFRYRGSDADNQSIVDRVNAGGEAFISQTAVRDRLCIRLAIGHLRTRPEDVRAAWEAILAATPA